MPVVFVLYPCDRRDRRDARPSSVTSVSEVSGWLAIFHFRALVNVRVAVIPPVSGMESLAAQFAVCFHLGEQGASFIRAAPTIRAR